MSINLVMGCLFLSAIAFAADAEKRTHRIKDVFTTPTGEQIVIMMALEYKGRNNDYVRVYKGSIDGGFESLNVVDVVIFRGTPGMIITLENGEVLKRGYPGKVDPSLGLVRLDFVPLLSETLDRLNAVQYPVPIPIPIQTDNGKEVSRATTCKALLGGTPKDES